ncbi:hypothetical protein NSQ62_08130 [Solibacillus sp. FSL H8-0523]|uniref:hypothetical protein n=1 Tax=Solibacillus sp. FSL H8-0523 TaxID=2954511 RepID=UPI003100B84B
MKLNYEVKRKRTSVTQGSAEVYLNNELVISFGDKIEIGGTHGENFGGWGSTVSDEKFIKGVLFPFFTNQEVIEKRVIEILKIND